MKFRWTIKDMEEKTDDEIIRGLIAERLSGLGPYTPLRERLQKIYLTVDKRIKEADENH